MNPEEFAARNAMMARLVGNPQPMLSQMSSGAGMPVAPQTPPVPQPQQNLGTQARKPSEHEKIVKSLLPATSSMFPDDVRGHSKVLIQKLLPYL